MAGKDAMHSFASNDDGSVRHVLYTGEKLAVPLPANTDYGFYWPIYSCGTYTGPGLPLPEEVESEDAMLETVHNTVCCATQEWTVNDIPPGGLHIQRGLLPNEMIDKRCRDTIYRMFCELGRISVGELLTKMIMKQAKWHKKLTKTPRIEWVVNQNVIWQRWASNPRLDWLWIVAIRRTLPDAEGRVYYFPELELHPMA
ncbi:hypothetical protein BD414DRAFT_510406 [Trametes punicea]|nr:hypothetical protein BD414DRAFT_510406 [Trametes punicea]